MPIPFNLLTNVEITGSQPGYKECETKRAVTAGI